MILYNATLVTLWARQPLVEGALLAIEGKTVVDFGKMGKLIDRYEHPDTLDVGGRVVMPGQIDLRGRLSRTLACGVAPLRSRPRSFRDLQENLWRPYDRALGEEEIYWSALCGLLDAVRSGVTTVVDHLSAPRAIAGSLDVVERAFTDVGVRGVLGYEVSDQEGPDCGRDGIEENRRFLEKRQRAPSEMIQGVFGLGSSHGLSDPVLESALSAAAERGALISVPLGESAGDLEHARTRFGTTPIERIAAAGGLRAGSLVAHGVHLEPGDFEWLARWGARVVHCPRSNAASGAGIADLPRLGASGIPLGLGTDGAGGSVLDEMRLAVLQQASRRRDPIQAANLAFRAAFPGNAKWASALFGPPVGVISPGARADLVVLDYEPATPLNQKNLVDHLYSGIARAPVRTVIINGKVVYRDGLFPGLEESRLRARAREVAGALWKKMERI